MAENQEQIESQLCAYVDDALDAQERAEIEKHLETHPQHRRLLEELKVHRDWVRALPHEAAPAELAESFTGQLERSVLLDGVGLEAPEPRIGSYRMPQFAALAAIIVLMVGLAVVIYVAMPKGKPQVAVASGLRPTTSQPTPAEAARKDGETSRAPLVADRLDKRLAFEPARDQSLLGISKGGEKVAERDKAAKPLGESSGSKLEAVARNIANNRQVQEMLFPKADEEQGAGVPPAARDAIVMVVNSKDPDQARDQLVHYFAENNIAWASPPAADAGSPGETKTADGRTESLEQKLGSARTTDAVVVAGKKEIQAKEGNGGGDDDHYGITANKSATQPAEVQAAPPVAVAAPLAQAASTQPALASANNGNAKSGFGYAAGGAASSLKDGADGDSVHGQLYVARHLSRRQAVELGESLRHSGSAQEAEVFANAFDSNEVATLNSPVPGAPPMAYANQGQQRALPQMAKVLNGTALGDASQSRELASNVTQNGWLSQAASAPATRPQQPAATQPAAEDSDVEQLKQESARARGEQPPAPSASATHALESRRDLQNAGGRANDEKLTAGQSVASTNGENIAGKDQPKAQSPDTAPAAQADQAPLSLQPQPPAEAPVDLVIVVQQDAAGQAAQVNAPVPAVNLTPASAPATPATQPNR